MLFQSLKTGIQKFFFMKSVLKFKLGHFISLNFAAMVMLIITMYHILGIIHRRKVSQITFFNEKTFTIQANSYIKILVEIKVQENISRFTKFANFFFRGQFPIYGI